MASLQAGWEVIKRDIMGVFREFHENGVVNIKTNATFICLIPKKLKSISIKDFRPISLVTSLYKVLAKVLSLRLKRVLGETIDLSQGAFVHGRQILDLMLIANEVVEDCRVNKREGVVFKIDFEKAYDHINWDFLDFLLDKKGFGRRWRSWIRGCLSSVNFSVMINGKASGLFGASRGLRQGDPLSPFLFILVADVLSRLMKRACEKKVVRGFEIGRNKTKISHLQFADDSIFFIPNDSLVADNLAGVLKVFSLVSGLKINMGKSIVVGLNFAPSQLSGIANTLGCGCGEWPLSYLGLPLGGNPNSIEFWNPVIERVSKRVDGWHKGCLSKGGRLTLLQSVLGSIPIYYLSIFKIPQKVASILEKLMRDFLWEGRGEGKKDHLVNWEVVSRSKIDGGLGVGNLIKRNKALLGKWLWRFPLESNSLWHAIIASKYGSHPNGWDSSHDINGSLRAP
ncbi:hypothetical protein LguiA_033544 [Lonicera macranthoides]